MVNIYFVTRMKIDSMARTDSIRLVPKAKEKDCFVGAHCGHATLTDEIGFYRCPLRGWCFKRLESQK